MRGKAAVASLGAWCNRITPAYAGKSQTPRGCRWRPKDHPRVCGEKLYRTYFHSSFQGSPPRMRGKATVEKPNRQIEGITPAYAGKSSCALSFVSPAEDHPRVCGEKAARIQCSGRVTGSPPRMRGKDMDTLQTVHDARITPAYAGKRRHIRRKPGVIKDHPRVCGEKTKKIP